MPGTANSSRCRWLPGEAWDSRYDTLKEKLQRIGKLSTPALMIQGGSDSCDAPKESAGLESHFTGGYKRLVLDKVGHFPHRENPNATASAILAHLAHHKSE